MNMPINVPVDDPNADTEWNDILRKHGIIPEKPKDAEPIIQEALLEAKRRAYENRLETKDLDELHDLEDEEDEDFLERYRQQRMAEYAKQQKGSIHGQVYPLQKIDYAKDVTEASFKSFVFVNMTSALDSNVESRLLSELWRELAVKFGDIKFCQIKAPLCIENYPEKNCPTILVYRDGDIKRQIVTLQEFGGTRTKLQNLVQLLVQVGAVDEHDARLAQKDSEEDLRALAGREKKVVSHDDDDDDDDW